MNLKCFNILVGEGKNNVLCFYTSWKFDTLGTLGFDNVFWSP